MVTLNFEKHWANPKANLVDPYLIKNGQNVPPSPNSCLPQCGLQRTLGIVNEVPIFKEL